MATFWEIAARSVCHMFLLSFLCLYFSSPEPKAHGEVIVYPSSRRPSMRPSVRLFTLSNMIISTTSRPIPTKFYLKHLLGWGKGCIRFMARSDWNSGVHGNGYLPLGYNEEKLVKTLAPSFLIGSSSYLQVTRTSVISRTSSNISQIRPRTAE